MSEAELSILVRAKGAAQAARDIGKVDSSIGRLSAHASRGVKTAASNIARIGVFAVVAAATVAAGAVAVGIRSLGDLARASAQTKAVIKSTGGAAGQTAASIRTLAESLENLSTVDDKVIQDGANMLLTFTGISKDVFPAATKAALDMAVAMAAGNVENVDMKTSSIALGKALNDPVRGITALRRVGVQFTKEQEKQIKTLVKSGDVMGAQKIILAELNKEFGNAAEAAGTGPEAVWRRLQDVGEDLSQVIARGLLPVLERAGKFLSEKLADPSVVATIDEIGRALGDAAGGLMDFIETVDFKAIADGLRIAAGAAEGIVSAFMSMPDWVKTAVIGGWGLNKLTGGALGGIVGELGKGLIKGVLGMNAGVVNINAGVVNGGGLPGGVGGTAAGAGAGGLTAGGIAAGAGALVVTAASAAVIGTAIAGAMFGKENASFASKGLTAAEVAAVRYYRASASDQSTIAKRIGQVPTKADYNAALVKLGGFEANRKTDAASSLANQRKGEQTNSAGQRTTAARIAALTGGTAAGLASTALAIQRAGERTAGAIDRKDLSVKVNPTFVSNVSVAITAASIKAKQSYSQRAGKANGSYGGNYDPRR